jgi:hypothetical protein
LTGSTPVSLSNAAPFQNGGGGEDIFVHRTAIGEREFLNIGNALHTSLCIYLVVAPYRRQMPLLISCQRG